MKTFTGLKARSVVGEHWSNVLQLPRRLDLFSTEG